MPADRGTDIDPGLHGEEPSAEELARQDALRSSVSVAELIELDLDDPSTPSRRGADGEPEPGSFDVPLEDFESGSTDAG